MLKIIVIFSLGFLFCLLLVNREDLIRSHRRRVKCKKYNRLKNGIPSKVEAVTSWRQFLKLVDKTPFYINGKIYHMKNVGWSVHCNTEHIWLHADKSDSLLIEPSWNKNNVFNVYSVDTTHTKRIKRVTILSVYDIY